LAFTIDPVVIGFATAASLLAGILFGLIPILKYGGPQFVTALRGTRTASHSRQRHRARNVLVVVQVALALVLLVASGLMIRTFQTLRVEPGFTRANELQMVRVSIPPTLIEDPSRVTRTYSDILEKLSALPGVTAAAFVSSAPLEGFNSNDPVVAADMYHVSPLDVTTYAGVSFVLLAAAMLASYVPARRAASLNPVEALLAE
jgi:putative ABC transport system permease protein